jgi:hypothetical protein
LALTCVETAMAAHKRLEENNLPTLPPPVLTGSGSMGSQVCVVTLPASQALQATPARLRAYFKGFSREYKSKSSLAVKSGRLALLRTTSQPTL